MGDWVQKIQQPAQDPNKSELAGPIDTLKRALGAAPEPGKRYPIAPLPVPGEAEEQKRLEALKFEKDIGVPEGMGTRLGSTIATRAQTPWGSAYLYAPGTPEFEAEAERLWRGFDKNKMYLEGPKEHQTQARGLSKWSVRSTLENMWSKRNPVAPEDRRPGKTLDERFRAGEEHFARLITDPSKRAAFEAAIRDPNRPVIDAIGTEPGSTAVPAWQAKGMLDDLAEFEKTRGPLPPPRSTIDFEDVDRQELTHQLGMQNAEASDLQRTVAQAMGVPPSSIRRDGTPQGPGWRGTWKSPDGHDVTEMSIGIQIGGIETEIPSIVPDTTDEECNAIAHGTIPDSALEKAQRFAEKRIKAGLSPFKETSDKETKARTYEQSKQSGGGSR